VQQKKKKMKFCKVILYCIAIANIIALEKNEVLSFPTGSIVKRENKDNRRIMITKVNNINKENNNKNEGSVVINNAANAVDDNFEDENDEDINIEIEEINGNLINNNTADVNNNQNEENEEINENNEEIIENNEETIGNNEVIENNEEVIKNNENENENNLKSNNQTEITNDEILNKNEPEINVEENLPNTTEKSKGSIKEFFEKTKDTVVDIYVTMPEEEYLNMTEAVQCVDYRRAKDFSTENATAQFEFNNEIVYLSKVKFSLGGASSRSFQKVGYNIKTLNKDNTLYGLKNIKLRGDERDPTHMVSRLSADFIKSVGLVAPSVAYSRLYINDIYMGLYTLQDVVKKHWIKEFFGEKDTKNCYKCETIGFNFDSFKKNKYPVTCKNINDDFADNTESFDKFIKNVNSAKSVGDLEKIMDIDIFLKYIAFEWIVLSWDHMLIYGHNFYWYLRSDGKWIPIYNDFDLTWYISNRVNVVNKTLDKKEKEKFPDDDHVFWPNMSLKDWEPGHKIIDILIHQDDTRFRKVVHEMVKKYYNPRYLNNKIDNLHNILKEYIIEDLMFIKDLKVKYTNIDEEKFVISNAVAIKSGVEELFSIQGFSNLEDEKLDLTNTFNGNSDESNKELVKRFKPTEMNPTSSATNNNIKMAKQATDEAESSKALKGIAGTNLQMTQRGRINLYGLNMSWKYKNYYEVINGENYIINTEGGTRSAPLKWTIQNRFNYLCHTYGINPETLELISPRPDVREWSSTNIYKLNAVYDDNNIVRFNYPNLDKEDFKTNYCKYCEITKEEGDKMLGFENNNTCIIHTVECGMEKGVEMGPNGYPYCQGCKVYDIKGGVLLGMEDKVLCEILPDNC